MTKPSIFIGSASEGLVIAQSVKRLLDTDFDCHIWNTVFPDNNSYFDTLIESSILFDFAILIATKDDTVNFRGVAFDSPRDNVIFEFGLFLGRIGKNRTFLLAEKDVKLPSDLTGISISWFKHDDSHAYVKDIVDKVRKQLLDKAKLSEVSLMPSTPLAISYFENFIKPVCESINHKNFQIDNQTFADKHLYVVMPDYLDADVKDLSTTFYNEKGLKSHEIPSKYGRPYPIRFASDIHNDSLTIYDVPNTLNGLRAAIGLHLRPGHIGKDNRQKMLEEKELRCFASTLQSLIDASSITKKVVKIISYTSL